MSNLQQSLDDYFEIRRALGFELQTAKRRLRDFLGFMEQDGASHITTELALRWARQPADGEPATWVQRLTNLRHFAAWYHARDRRTEVPPQGLLPHRFRRKPPYIYSDEEIESLVQSARGLPSPKGLRGHTYSTTLGLLAATGMRVSEVVALDREHVDLDEAIVTIRRTKFGKSRIVPVHVSTRDALAGYAEARDRLFPVTTTRAFFLSERGGNPITSWGIRYNFAKVSRQVGLRGPVEGNRHGHGPRLHDMRHRFAARTLINWYRAGLDVEREMPKLSTYLGHVHVNDTYWYIEAVPELLRLATERLVDKRDEVEP
jgi:site-specific recombinase XerD